jgi:hypothetical protein
VRRRPGSGAVTGLVILGAVSLLAGCGGAGSGSSTTTATGGPHVLRGDRGTVTAATVEVVSGATAVAVSAESLGRGLYRVSTPVGSGIRPLATRHGRTVLVGETGAGKTTEVPSIDVVLAQGVRWTIDLDGGATTETVRMGEGSLSALAFGAGVSMASVQLPPAVGTQTVTLAGGASQLVIMAPPGAPAQVDAVGGASLILLDGIDHTGVAGGSVFSDPGWASSSNRYDIDLTSGVSDFRMTRS